MYGFYNSKLKQQMRFFVTVNQMFSGSYCWAHGSDNETVLGSCQKLGGAVNIWLTVAKNVFASELNFEF